jgi:hypothetical protein
MYVKLYINNRRQMKRGIAKVNIVFTLTEEYFVQPLRLLNAINFILITEKGGINHFVLSFPYLRLFVL